MRRPFLIASAALAPLALAVPAAGDPLLTATISQSAVADSNYRLDDSSPGTSYYADTRIELGYLNETPTQVFALGLDTGLRALWEAEEDFDFTFASPTTASLGYDQEWAGAELATDFSFRQTDVDVDRDEPGQITIDDPVTGLPIIVDTTERATVDVTERRYAGAIDFGLATDAPSSYLFSLAGSRFDYDDDGDSGRVPRTSAVGDATWRLRFNPILSGTLGVGYSYYDADNVRETQIRTGDATAGVIYQPSERLRLDAGLGYADRSKRERDADGSRDDDDRTGVIVNAGVRYDFDEILVVGEAAWTEASVGSPFTGALRAIYELPRGELSGRVFQRKAGASSGGEAEVLGAAIGLTHEINTVSAFAFDVTATRQEDITGPDREPDTTRYGFSAVYSHALTEVVAASVGYRYRTFEQDPDDADSNSVFVEIGRTFSTLP
jgi:opacity protein-like surface antigen